MLRCTVLDMLRIKLYIFFFIRFANGIAMELLFLRLASLLAVGLVYMLFDVFNNRNVPSLFAYAALGYGLVLTLLYLNVRTIAISLAVSAAVLGLGYVVYRMGQVGAGDILEFAALSLILPIQPAPLISGAPGALTVMPQLGIPFIVSLFIGTGVVALVAVPLYYIPKARRMSRKPISSMVDRKDIAKAFFVGLAWLMFAAFLILVVGASAYGIVLLALIMLGSVAVIVYEKPITDSMVDMVDVSGFEEGDIVAFNLMTQRRISSVKKRVRSFDRLVTGRMLDEMRRKRVRERFPVYKRAIPLAVPIFFGIVISIMLGNVILLLLPL